MRKLGYLLFAPIVAAALPVHADEADDLAKALSNPVAAMISVPFVFNADFGYGPPGNGTGYTLNIQPVIPFTLSPDWNLISRTILPVKFQDDIFPNDVFGLGDTVQSLFFSPSAASSFIWGVGPVFLIPTATDPLLGTGKWGAGPTGLGLIQHEQWTVGVLAYQLWSVAGDPARAEVSQAFVQPFVSYALGGGKTLSANIEMSHDWISGQTTAPLNLSYSKVFKVGEQTLSWQFGGKVYIASPPGGPDWGIRTGLTFLFPQKK